MSKILHNSFKKITKIITKTKNKKETGVKIKKIELEFFFKLYIFILIFSHFYSKVKRDNNIQLSYSYILLKVKGPADAKIFHHSKDNANEIPPDSI